MQPAPPAAWQLAIAFSAENPLVSATVHSRGVYGDV
jgi:hypothetical protein